MIRKLKIMLIVLTSIVGVLFIVLVIQIATAKEKVYDNATIQISRIDFEETLDSIKIKDIHRKLKNINGVINDSYNLNNNVLVVFHDNRLVNANQICKTLVAEGNYEARVFEVSDEIAKKQVCPVIEKGSFSYHLTKGVKRIFN